MSEPPQGGSLASDNPWSSLEVPIEGPADEAGGPTTMDAQETPEGGQPSEPYGPTLATREETAIAMGLVDPPKPTADSETQTAGDKTDEPMPGTAEDREEESERAEPDAHSHVAPSSPGVVSVDVEPEEDMVGEAYEALGREEEPAAAIEPGEPEPGTNRW